MRFPQWAARGTGVILGAALSCGVAAGQPAESPPLAALISELSGGASIRSNPAGPVTTAQRFDALAHGATLELGPEARAVLVLSGGQRFEFGPKAQATIAARELTSVSGPVTELPPLPALPRIAALAGSRPSGPPGGIRLRGEAISGLRPSHAVIATEPVTLRFDPVGGASRYAVQVEDAAGRRIFVTESSKPELDVPPGVLEPGASFYWTVQTLDKLGGDARGTSQFRTLSHQETQLRQVLRRSLQSEDGAAATALLAEIDRRLGLYREALEGFRAVLARTQDDVAIQRAIRWLETLERPVPGTSGEKPTNASPSAATAKELFTSAGDSAVAHAGLKYRIIQELAPGEQRDADPTTTFRPGDRVKFAFESNINGFLYVVYEGSSGRWDVLFPTPDMNGGSHRVSRHREYEVPGDGWFAFDNNPGVEHVFVIVSKEPLEQLPGFNRAVTKPESVRASVVLDLQNSIRSRDLIFQKDPPAVASGRAQGSYVVNRDELGKRVSATIALRHGQ